MKGAGVILALTPLLVGASPPTGDAGIAQRSAAIADAFQAKLQVQLKAALQAGGPLAALNVCKQVAPAIAAQMSQESGAQVSRVSLKPRNPSARTGGVLREKLTELAAKPLTQDGKPRDLVWTSGTGPAAETHYLRAIPMKAQPCAACHGTNVAPEVKAKIAELYPDDQATGFKPGELRGAFLISWPAMVRHPG